jgi:ribose transport system substrate-binding protein
MSRPEHSRSRRSWPVIGVVTAAVLFVAACGDDDDATTPTSAASAPTTAATEPTTAATEPTTAATEPTSTSAPSSDAGTPENVAAAQQVVAEFSQPLTQASTEALDLPPIGTPVPADKTVTYISCGTPGCNASGDILKSVAELLGWTTETIATDGTPQQIQNAWVQVLREKPDGVWVSGFSRSLFNQEVLDAEAAGIAVVSTGTLDPIGDGIVWVDGPGFYNNSGELMANWVLANSDGAPNVLYTTIQDYPIVGLIEDSFRKTLSETAPDAKVETLTIPLEALGTTAPDLYISALRSNPDIEFVVPAFDELYSGVPAALSAANLEVKAITVASTATGLQAIQDGYFGAGVPFDSNLEIHSVVDALARVFAGEAVLGGVQYPKVFVTNDNLPPIQDHYPVLPGLDEYFSTVWGVS